MRYTRLVYRILHGKSMETKQQPQTSCCLVIPVGNPSNNHCKMLSLTLVKCIYLQDPTIKMLADKGYNMIFSNYDSLYLDCGYSAWVGEGNNWCTPYKGMTRSCCRRTVPKISSSFSGWQKIYQNDPYEMLEMRNVILTEEKKKQVLGGEVAMWTEQVDTYSVESKIFPRADALAERLWSNPQEKWYRAEQRMLQQRWRLTHREDTSRPSALDFGRAHGISGFCSAAVFAVCFLSQSGPSGWNDTRKTISAIHTTKIQF